MTTTTDKLYIIGADNDGFVNLSPNTAKFEASLEFAKRIQRLAQVVKDNELFKVELFYALPDFYSFGVNDEADDILEEFNELLEEELDDGIDESEQAPNGSLFVSNITLNVTNDEFWFAGNVKHCSTEFTTDRCSIEELLTHFGLDS